jgi:hypothetical protein
MMKNVDVEIYVNQLISFFEKNPNDLINLIGDSLKDRFFEKIKKQCLKNAENGEEVSLTQKQIIDIVVEMKSEEVAEGKKLIIHKVFEQNKAGVFCLN